MRINKQILTEYLKNPLYRNSLFLIFRTAIRGVVGLVFWIVVARFYTEAEVGWGSAIISAISLLALLCRLGFNASLIRFLSKTEEPREMINSCFIFTGIIGLIVSAVFILGVDFFSPALSFIKENIIFSLTVTVIVLAEAFSELSDSVFVARRKAEFALHRMTIMVILRLAFATVMAMYFHAFGIVASWGIAVAISFIVALFVFLPRVERGYLPLPRIKFNIIGNMWQYAAGSYLTSLLQAAPASILPIIVINLRWPEENAYFYMAWALASALFAIPAATSLSLFAEGSHFEHKLREYLHDSIKFTFLVVIPAAILLVVFGKWILLLFGEKYLGGLPLLRILCLSSVFVALNTNYTSTLRVEHRMKEMVLLYGFEAAAVLLGSYFIIGTHGITAIGYIWLATHAAVSLYASVMMRLRYRSR